jgi:glyoxylase-like metal-dependent hydrolase (beta-lactamase superfamily II)
MFLVLISPLKAQTEKKDISLTLKNVSGDIYCLEGHGGNMGILKTGEGLLIIDSKTGEVTDALLKELITLSNPLKIKYLIHTHYHGDHTGGDEALGKYTETIIMHPNAQASLSNDLKEKATEKTFMSKIKPWTQGMVIKIGDETIRLLHLNPAHTAGDLVVVFEKARIIHAGDLFFNGLPAYIDVADGSDTGNWVNTIETVCDKYPDYKYIPGHGNIATAKDWLRFAEYLKYLREEVSAAIMAGKTKEQAIKSIKIDQFKQIKANEIDNFMTIQINIGWIYDEMTRHK